MFRNYLHGDLWQQIPNLAYIMFIISIKKMAAVCNPTLWPCMNVVLPAPSYPSYFEKGSAQLIDLLF